MKIKRNVIFYGKVDSYLVQLYMFPILLILGAFSVAYLSGQLNLDKQLSLSVFVVYWVLLGYFSKSYRPFMLFAGAEEGSNETKITVVNGRKKISGVLDGVELSSDQNAISFVLRGATKKLEVPIENLGPGASRELIDAVQNIVHSDFRLLEQELQAVGVKTKIHDDPKSHYSIHAGTTPNFNSTNLILAFTSLIVSLTVVL